MVDTNSITPISASVVQSTVNSLRQLSNFTLTSQQFVAIAEQLYWSLLEGEYRRDRSSQAHQLREIFADITTQWECLSAHLYETTPTKPAHRPEFPPEWVHHWLEQIQHIEATLMTEPSKNQPTFHIGQVGNINPGDVTIQGDQVGIQHNYAPAQKLAAAATEIQQLLDQLAQTYPTATEAEVPNMMKTELARMERNQPEKWAMLRRDLLNKERWFQGGKAVVTEVTKHLADKSVVVKGAIAFLEGFSKDIG